MTRLDADLGGTDGAWVWLYPPGSRGTGPFGTTYSKQPLQPDRSRCTRYDSVLGTFGQVFLLSVPGLVHFVGIFPVIQTAKMMWSVGRSRRIEIAPASNSFQCFLV